MLNSTTLRIGLLYTGVFTLSVLAILAIIYWLSVNYLVRQTEETINSDALALAERYERSSVRGLSTLVDQRARRQTPTSDSIYLLTDNRLQPITGNLNRWPPGATEILDGWIDFQLGERSAGDIEPRQARGRTFQLRGGYRLLVGRDVSDLDKLRRRLRRMIGLALGLTLALGALGAVLLTRLVMRRLETINKTSQEIMTGDFSQRIPVRGSRDEFDRLSHNLNTMMDRIENLMEGIHRVSDNIAHDLKTPLARLRNRLELAKVHGGNADSQAETIEQALSESDQLLKTFDALLRIARIETGKAQAQFENVDLTELVEDVVELYAPIAEDRQVILTQAPIADNGSINTRVCGDRDLLFQALANLVDNAIKYTADNTEVQVGLEAIPERQTRSESPGHTRASNSMVILSVRDRGPGIKKEHYEKATQRFFRGDNARTTAGNGLGLSLVDAVVRAHHGTLQFADNQPGLHVTVALANSPAITPLSH